MNFKAEASWSNEKQETWARTSQGLDEQREQRLVSEPGTREDPGAAPSRQGAEENQSHVWNSLGAVSPRRESLFKTTFERYHLS